MPISRMYFDGGENSYAYILDGVGVVGVVVGGTATTEYTGLISGLQHALSLGVSHIHILGDSRSVLHQLTGQVKVRKTHSLHKEAMRLLGLFDTWTVEWIPSPKNPADKLIPKRVEPP
jgi:ribonuclease HI